MTQAFQVPKHRKKQWILPGGQSIKLSTPQCCIHGVFMDFAMPLFKSYTLQPYKVIFNSRITRTVRHKLKGVKAQPGKRALQTLDVKEKSKTSLFRHWERTRNPH